MLSSFNPKNIEVLRCISDLKYGIPITLEHNNQKKLIFSVERINAEIFKYIKNTFEEIYLVLSDQRVGYLKFKDCKIDCKNINFNEVQDIVFKIGEVNISFDDFYRKNTIDNGAIKIMKISELIPAALVVKISSEQVLDFKINSLKLEYISDYVKLSNSDFYEVSSADLRLKYGNGQIKCFRSQFSKDHYAVIIYPNDKNNFKESSPTVRVHSSCFTGDLFNSIKCDCYDQLHNAIKIMSENNGGVIIYLNQEGRGIGLTNKIRVYSAQSKGFDTVEANENLGLDDDARIFQIAAKILKNLKIKKINLLSNNPKKAKDLKDSGIIVEKVISHQFFNSEIKEYYESKVKKFKHNIEI